MSNFDEQFQDLIIAHRISDAVLFCTTIELRMYENNFQASGRAEFYCSFMASHLILNDLIGARYLWRRSPIDIKENSSEFIQLWTIGQSLWQSDIHSAFTNMSSFQFSPIIELLIEILKTTIRENQINTIAKAFTTVSVTYLTDKLYMSLAEVIAEVRRLNWEMDGEEFVKPIFPPKENSNFSHLRFEKGDKMEKLTEYVSFFERKAITSDMIVKPPAETTTEASKSAK